MDGFWMDGGQMEDRWRTGRDRQLLDRVVGALTWLYPRMVASFLIPNHLAGSTGSLYREESNISSGERFVSFDKGYENERTNFNIKAIKATVIKSVKQYHFYHNCSVFMSSCVPVNFDVLGLKEMLLKTGQFIRSRHVKRAQFNVCVHVSDLPWCRYWSTLRG